MRSTGPLAAVDRLPGLGPKSRAALAAHGVRTVADLLWTPPSSWDDRRDPLPLAEAVRRGGRVVFRAIVVSAAIVPIRRRSVRVVLRDEQDEKCKLHAFWFYLAHGVLAVAEPGAAVVVAGVVVAEAKKPPRTIHPDIALDRPEARVVRSRYPKLGPSPAALEKAIAHALEACGAEADPVPAAIAAREGMPNAGAVLAAIHRPTTVPPEEVRRAFVERLAWVEAFTRSRQRRLAELAEADGGSPRGTPLPELQELARRVEGALAIRLTGDQRAALDEIARDLAAARPMRRLLLGDVGTGKTAVAVGAVLQCVAAKKRAAILAPTNLLAEQYAAVLRRVPALRVALVVAGAPADEAAEADVAVGTHALLAAGRALPELALVVVDEQQRLGVAQRLALVQKGVRPHVLTLTATPIPRTLALALRGDLATSVLRERPAKRGRVATSLAAPPDIDAVVARVRAAIEDAGRVFWVVPRLGEDDDDGDADASLAARAEALGRALGAGRVGAVHGRQKSTEQRAAMEAFRSGARPVLVATSVIEVGLDVPEATLIVVEGAERFGLAQLHQLRGRVGRGVKPGACVLLSGVGEGGGIDARARERLDLLTRLETGEEVAAADLAQRGAGDLGGTRQHGDEGLVYLEPGASYAWLGRIDADVAALDLGAPENAVLRSLVDKLGVTLAIREDAG